MKTLQIILLAITFTASPKSESTLNSGPFGSSGIIYAESILAGETMAHSLSVVAGQEVEFLVSDNGGSNDLDLFVYNHMGVRIAEDIFENSTQLVRFVAPEGGNYRIRIVRWTNIPD